jgi:dipeptidase E
MKLVLASAGINTKGVAEKVIELVGKPPNQISVAIIHDAPAVLDVDMRWQINEMQKISKLFGGMIRIVNLLALDIGEIKNRLAKSDVVFCLGGNACYLKTVFDKSGLGKILPEILKDVVWLGNSAGSMVLGKFSPYRESVATKKKETYGVDKFFKIVDCHIIPHINFDDDPKHSLETCTEESKRHTSPVYALTDNSALVIDGDKTYLFGKGAWKIFDGKITEHI